MNVNENVNENIIKELKLLKNNAYQVNYSLTMNSLSLILIDDFSLIVKVIKSKLEEIQ